MCNVILPPVPPYEGGRVIYQKRGSISAHHICAICLNLTTTSREANNIKKGVDLKKGEACPKENTINIS
jgi:hypothetical protein